MAREKVLRLGGPGAVVSFPLLHMVETNALAEYAERVEFHLWQNPDQLRVLLAKNELDYSAVPVNLPALMAGRGQHVRLLNVSVWGIIWLVSRDPQVKGFADLAGKDVVLPFQRDLPAILIDELLLSHGLKPGKDLTLRPVRDGQDAQALLLAGRADHALLVEPAVSLLLWRNRSKGGAPLYRVQSLESAWKQAFAQQPELPQAGLMSSPQRAEDGELARAVEAAYAESARWCSTQPRDCAELVHRHLPHLPVEAVEESIRVTRLDSVAASVARGPLEALFGLIAERHPQAIGGSMPSASFYGP
ncbi:ABC transporter substrate-binding protein [Pseudomonas multiresinivorans]|uniref:ABC transporter substrate-binding protein n=1 Tax=Pseudomonas multiresinivorans TaxID=95301 RepID=UPI0014742692|nr:ABC transporter substrate-binding protein [Pseudomonas multiresinivorans]